MFLDGGEAALKLFFNDLPSLTEGKFSDGHFALRCTWTINTSQGDRLCELVQYTSFDL